MCFDKTNMEKEEAENKKESSKDSESPESKKKGGPYPKKEQEDRRSKVYNLHFEQAYSAIKIAEMLQINRNTINEDIHFLYDEIGKQIPKVTSSLVLKQFERFEIQYARLSYGLEYETDFKNRIIIEKMLNTVTDKLAQLSAKFAMHKWDIFAGGRNSGCF